MLYSLEWNRATSMNINYTLESICRINQRTIDWSIRNRNGQQKSFVPIDSFGQKKICAQEIKHIIQMTKQFQERFVWTSYVGDTMSTHVGGKKKNGRKPETVLYDYEIKLYELIYLPESTATPLSIIRFGSKQIKDCDNHFIAQLDQLITENEQILVSNRVQPCEYKQYSPEKSIQQ